MRHRWIWPSVLAAITVGALVLALILSSPGGFSRQPAPAATYPAMADGIGDEYYPKHGNAGLDIKHYAIDVSWDPATRTLNGTAKLSAIATTDLSSFFLDLNLLAKVARVDGQRVKFTQDGSDLKIQQVRIAKGTAFTVEIDYAGNVEKACSSKVAMLSGNELLIAGEPESATCWYPANDHPRDPATFEITIRALTGQRGITAGRLKSADGQASTFVIETPTPTYTTFLAVGAYEIRTGRLGDKPTFYAVSTQLSPAHRAEIFAELAKSVQVVEVLTGIFGPYPAVGVGGVVTSERMWFAALETSSSPLYGADYAFEPIIVHELAHMWVGNHVTVSRWQDIWLNEGMASYAVWVYSERVLGRSARDRFREASKQQNAGFWRANLRKPPKDSLFHVVYQRGPMVMHALREVMGDTKFFPMWKQWAQTPGPRTVEDFITVAERHHGASLQAFFEGWLDGKEMPRTPAFGFR